MEKRIEERIEFYCQIYEQIYQRISKVNPENATDIALGIFEELAKDLRSERIAQSRKMENRTEQKREGNDSPATEKQREALHKFGVKKVPENLSVREASKILDRLISLSKENDRTSIDRAIEELNKD